MTNSMVAVRLGFPEQSSTREHERLSGERGQCRNCLNCGSRLWLPQDVPDGYGGDLDYTFDCPRCRSVYAAEAAGPSWLEFELAVLQNEHRGARAKQDRRRVPRDSVYRDPIYGDVKRAQDRQASADQSLADALHDAHVEHRQSIRQIALSTGMKKSQVHEIVKRERERREQLQPRAETRDFKTVPDWDDIPF